MLLGCIADDFTGATDLANNLVRAGMRTIQTIGLPQPGARLDADAVVVALKSRTIPADDAIAQSLAALQWLQAAGCKRFYFKYCSTFDSTDRGNIGPVTEALMKALDTDFTIACPAFPATGRTIFRGHLFVGDQLLSDSGMRNHPLTPMTDANLVAVLQRQVESQVGLLRYDTLAAGIEATHARIAELRGAGIAIAVADSLHDADLHTLATACAKLPLITAGSGVAIGLPAALRKAGLLQSDSQPAALPNVPGPAIVLSGSCSAATLAQVAAFSADNPSFRIDPLRIARGDDVVGEAIALADQACRDGRTAIVYASAATDEVRAVQGELGREQAGELVEGALAACASRLRDRGTRRFVVAGGETSGAVVQALGIHALRIGPQIDPGVPWTESVPGGLDADGSSADEVLAIALKSGNFGAIDFFAKSLAMLDTAGANVAN